MSERSRQYEWQVAKIARGGCRVCGGVAEYYTNACVPCTMKQRLRMRRGQAGGGRPWLLK